MLYNANELAGRGERLTRSPGLVCADFEYARGMLAARAR